MTPEGSDANLAAALDLASGGWLVMPCRPEKVPYLDGWPSKGTTDPSVIRAWWGCWPTAIPALPCGSNNLAVVDADRHEGGADGMLAWAHQCAQNGLDQSACPIVTTPTGGGQHVYFRQAQGERVRNSAGKIAEGVDVRGDGGYVIAPGAVLPDGRAYRLISGSLKSIPVIPQGLHAFLTTKTPGTLKNPDVGNAADDTPALATGRPSGPREAAYAAKVLAVECDRVQSAPVGQRNPVFNSAVFAMATMIPRFGVSVDDLQPLKTAALANGLVQGEVEATFKSALAAGMAQPRLLLGHDDPPQIDLAGLKVGGVEILFGRSSAVDVGWPEPDPRLLNGGARTAPRFPLSALGPLAQYVGELAAAKDGPPDYLAVALLTAAAGVIGGARAVQLRSNWIEPCILWGMLIGNASAGKTQPLDAMKRAARAIEPDDAPDFADHHRAWHTAVATAKEIEAQWLAAVKRAVTEGMHPPMQPESAEIPAEPMRPRIVIGSATVEKLGLMFAAFPRGLLLLMDEGAAWFGNFGKYGGDGDAAYFLSAFSGIGTTVDRVKEGGSVAPAHALLSVCVGIQPERLNELLLNGRADDGLVSRFLPAWPDAVAPVWDTPHVDEGQLERLLRRLRTLKPSSDAAGLPAPVIMHLSPEAEALFAPWWTKTKNTARGASGLLAGFIGKSLGVAGRLALVIELLTWATSSEPEPTTVSAQSMASALALSEDYFAPMAAKVYGDASRPIAERAAASLLKAVISRDVRVVNKRQVYRDWGLPGLTSPVQVQAALDVLTEGDCLRTGAVSGAKGGRPSADYVVNPRVFGCAT